MDKKHYACEAFLRELIRRPTPGTCEDSGQKLVLQALRPLCDRVETDIYGDVLGALNEKARTRVLLAAHVDEIALVVSNIDDQGFVQVNLMGGSRPDALVGQRLHIHAAGGPVLGVVGRKPGEAPKEEIKVADLYLDIGATSREEAAKLVRPGDTATVVYALDRLGGDRVTGRGLDDRAGVAAVVRAMELIRRGRKRLKVAVFALSNVQEEGGRLRGASVSTFRIMPQAALAVDVCYARDYPKMETRLSGNCRLSGGPTLSLSLTANRAVNRMLEAAAKANKIPLQYAVEPSSTGTDGDAIASVGPGVATGVVSIPCRYVHSPSEVISLADLDQTAELLAEFVLRRPAQPDFKPI
jgi:putative aminopeptidase FrvX